MNMFVCIYIYTYTYDYTWCSRRMTREVINSEIFETDLDGTPDGKNERIAYTCWPTARFRYNVGPAKEPLARTQLRAIVVPSAAEPDRNRIVTSHMRFSCKTAYCTEKSQGRTPSRRTFRRCSPSRPVRFTPKTRDAGEIRFPRDFRHEKFTLSKPFYDACPYPVPLPNTTVFLLLNHTLFQRARPNQ